MTLRHWIVGILLALSSANQAVAQGAQCAIPPSLPTPRTEYPPPGEAQNVPVTGHLLALSWSPQFCKAHDGDKFDSQCKAPQSFGFILHGLWADGNGRTNPQWCKKVDAVPRDVMRQTWCATPSADLQQHEWAKHGSCIAPDAGRYFRNARLLFEALKWPDMNALSRQSGLKVGAFKQAFVAANPGLSQQMLSVSTNQLGWLEEVKLCLGVDLHPRACPRAVKGVGDGAKLRIWRSEK